MEPKFQTSFIPKKPISESSFAPVQSLNIFSLLATAVFIVTVIISGGLFGYTYILQGQIKQADTDLNTARGAYQTDTIQDLLAVSSRLLTARQLLDKHVKVSEIFTLLQSLTVKKVRFTAFDYTNTNSIPAVSMSGEAQSYNAIAEQSTAFSQNQYIKNINFSNLDLGDDGKVKMKFEATIDPNLISYKKAIQALTMN